MAQRRKTRVTPRARRERVKAPAAVALSTAGLRRPGYELSPDALERSLRAGTDVGLLEDYFGEAAYQELRELSLEAAAARVRGGPRVLILPGIMGSTLGIRNRIGPFDDVLWLDPLDIGLGNLTSLALGASNRVVALGVIAFTYLRLKLRLQRAGYDVDFHPFDWRLGIDQLGEQLAKRLAAERQPKVQLVAHSMGGLVARAALTHAGGDKVQRLVMLGTPNFGSFVPVQAIRGTALVARALAAADPFHSAEELSQKVFRTFPGLVQMFPAPERFKSLDLYTREGWPTAGPLPDFDMLRSIARVRSGLAAADSRFFLIAGVDQETPTSVSLGDREFVYEYSSEGDGTVPLAFAELPGASTYYVDEAHSSLPNNGSVGGAVAELLGSGTTRILSRTREPRPLRAIKHRTDSELRARRPYDGRSGGELSAQEIRTLAREFIAPDARDTAAAIAGLSASATAPATVDTAGPTPGFVHTFEGLVVGRRRQRQLEIRLAQGSISSARAQAYVIGVYQGVEPAGPAHAIDLALDGAIKEFVARRMFSASAGAVFALPTREHLLHAETVLLAGLGSFDQFNGEVQQLVAENVSRSLIRTGVDDFAMVLFGAGSGHSVGASLYNCLVGTFRAVRDTRERVLRRVTLCELDAARFVEMKAELLRLASTPLFDDVNVSFEEVSLPPPLEAPAARRPTLSFSHPLAYLHVRREPGEQRGQAVRSTVLTAGPKATVITGVKSITEKALDEQLRPIVNESLGFAGIRDFGSRLAQLVLAEDVLAVLESLRDYHLVVVHDAESSRFPWETLCVRGATAEDDWCPARGHGLSRRYIAENMSVSKWLEARRSDSVLNILLVSNPTEDLDGADREAERLKKLFASNPNVQIEELARASATKPALLSAFRSGRFDVLHYAGHAFFDERSPSHSGIVCANEQVLAGAELANLSRLPSLVFFNACEAARIRARRKGGAAPPPVVSRPRRTRENVGLAEAFLRGGVPNYIGTYWPVGDAAAEIFASEFYGAVLAGEALGEALGLARKALYQKRERDWANYVLYGACDFSLKVR